MAAGRPLGKVEEEAQEALEGLGGSQSKEDGGLRQPGETGRCWEESLATEQTSGGGEGSSRGSQAERQVTEDWEGAKAIRCQDSGIPLEARKKSEAGQDRRSQALESQEHDEQEVKREETLRTWEREEEEVRATEPGVAGGVESERAWHKEPEGKAGADGHKVAGDGKKSEQVVSEAAAEEIQGPGAKGAGREEGVVVVRCGRSPRALGTQDPGAESEDGEASGREEADLPGVEEAEYGAVPEKRIPEGTGRVWALEETSKRDQEEEVDENRETEVSLFPEQTQVLGTRRVEAEAKGQAAGRETEEGPRSVGEVREGFEGQADRAEEEAVGRQDSEVKAGQASLKAVVQTEEAKEQKKESCSAAEAELPQAKVANEAKGDADLEATPEARSQQFNGGRGEEETQTGDEALEEERGGLEHKVTGGQEPELMGGPQTTTEQLEEGPVGKEELQSILALSREETGRSLQEYPRHVGHVKPNSSVTEAWENRRKDVERDDAQEEKGDAEEGEEEATRGQALVVEAAGGRELARPAIPEAGGEWMEAWHGAEEAEAPGAENQEQGRRHGAEAGTSQFLGELDIRETQEEEAEAPGPFGEDRPSGRGWRLEAVAVNPQSSEGPEANSLAVEMVEDNKAALDGGALGPGEEPEREAGDAFGRGWDSEGREEAHRGELVEAAEGEKRRGQEFGLEGSAEEEVPGQGSQAEAPEATLEGEPEGEVMGLGESAGAEGICEVDDFPSGSQALRAEDLPGGQALWEGEAGGWRAREQGQSGEGLRGNQHPEEGKAQRPLDVEDAGVTGGQKAEAAETDPDGLEDIQGLEDVQALEDQSTNEGPAEAEPGPRGEADGSAGQDADGKWGEVSTLGRVQDRMEQNPKAVAGPVVPCALFPIGPAPRVPPGRLCLEEPGIPVPQLLEAPLSALFPTDPGPGATRGASQPPT